MGVRDFLARHAVKNLEVYHVDDFSVDPPEVVRLKSRVETFSGVPEIKISVSKPLKLSQKIECKAKRVKFDIKSASSRNVKIKRYVKQNIKTHKTLFNEKIKTSRILKEIRAMPQERQNILKLQKKRPPVANNEMILACYGPIVEGAVERLVLNKEKGTLLVWYSSGSRKANARYVYLIRRLGMGSKPEWRWL